MPMPSLLKYFAFVGVALLALLTFVNFLLEPSTGATVVAKPVPATQQAQQAPRTSNMARWQDDAAERKAAEAEFAARAAEPEPPVVQQASAKPMTAAPAALSTDVTAAADDTARAARRAEAKRLKAERARKAKIARERAQARELAAGRKQDQYFYGQQQAYAPPPPPRPDFGPFGGGWGRGW
jgi:hypothetical protein